MSYRGGDLDLRTPQSRSGGERGAFELPTNGTRDFEDAHDRAPIWVDDTLLTCCNHAFDIALAHRSADVRLEHLLFALTRIDDAAEVLEKHGIRDASLRREAGAYIASEIPISPTNGQTNPRRSAAFEQALKASAKYAYTRNRPASVSDLLHVLLEVHPELPGLHLLHRHKPGLMSDNTMASPSYTLPDTAFHVAPPEPPRRATRPAYYDDYAMMEAQSYRQSAVQSHTDMVQNSRLAALEQLVLSLREDTGRFADDMTGRFVSLEQTFSTRGGSEQSNLRTTEKLGDIERSLVTKIGELSREASQLSSRLEAMEKRLETAYETGGIDLTPLEARLVKLEGFIREERTAGEAAANLVSDRVASEFETRMRQLEGVMASGGSVTVDLVPIEGRLNDIETALLSTSDSSDAVARLATRLDNLEAGLANRIANLHHQSDTLAADVKALNQNTASLGSETRASLQHLDKALQERIAAITQLTKDMEASRSDLAAKLVSLETMAIRHGQEAAEGRETSVRELGEVHEAIMKLNANQHTLAGAIDQWRSESVSDMNTIATRLTQLDVDNDAPIQRLDYMSERVDAMYRATVERYHRRNRFWYWLFGTDDWIGASWPSQSQKVEQELETINAGT
ncbi:MAG: Clp protease N-terminal domain-containing protein [Filomicrobium sp.]